jgi:integrase/recombinase XerC
MKARPRRSPARSGVPVASDTEGRVPTSADQALVQAYLRHVEVEKRLAARTLALYAEHLQHLATLCAQVGVSLPELSEALVRRWVAQLHSAGRAPKGIALVLSSWRGFYRWLGHQGRLAFNPVQAVRAPKAPQPLPKALSVEDALRLAEPGDLDADPVRAACDHCVVELLYGCGMRLGELLGLDLGPGAPGRGWVDMAAAEAHVLGKGGKRRALPLGAPALQALATWLERRPAWAKDDAALFIGPRGARLTPQALRLRLRRRSLQAGLAVPVHPHMLRHSFASHVLQSSGDLRGVQELLGHASIASTQVYTRLDFQHLARVYEAAHPRAGGGGRKGG